MSCFRAIAICAIAVSLCAIGQAQIIFEDDMSDGMGWSTFATSDTSATFGYDYSADAIPEAPNTPMGATARTGLKMEANLVLPTSLEEIAAIPDGISLSGQYRMQVDIWANYIVGSGVTTEFQGVFVGHDGSTAGRNGAGLLYDGDGDSGTDYRLFKDAGQQDFASLQYSPPYGDLTESNNNTDPAFLYGFPGFDVGFALDPVDGQGGSQVGVQPDGLGGFQWMTLEVIVDPDGIGQGIDNTVPGTAEFRLTSQTNPANPMPMTVWVGTIDNTNGGATVSMTGAPALVYADIFTSVADDPQFVFGIYDNVIIEQLSAGGVDGDFDDNGAYECNDVDQLVAEIVAVAGGGMPDLNFDMTGDGNVNGEDLDAWRTEAGAGVVAPALTASGNPVQLGDATLDGITDGLDFIEWNENKFTNVAAWCSGDFTADGVVDGLDFIEWNNNKFTSADGLAAVPEPSGLWLLLLGVPFALRRRQ